MRNIDYLLKSTAIVCMTAVTLACLTLTVVFTFTMKAFVQSLPPPFDPMMGMGMGAGMMPPPLNGRGWGPEQATGEPNTTFLGDQVTAWASLTPDANDEWLELTYNDAVTPTAIVIHETYNPGALVKITSVSGTRETVLWQGEDPVKIKNGIGIAEIPVSPAGPVSAIKLYIASRDNMGWNEIDAVGLKTADGEIAWADSAEASTTYAQPSPTTF